MIIGLLGYSKTGKDTVGSILTDQADFQTIAFADPLKRVCRQLFGFSRPQLWGDLKEEPDQRYPREHEWGPRPTDGVIICRCCRRGIQAEGNLGCFLTPRYAFQIMGTEVGLRCYQNIWVDMVLHDIRDIEQRGLVYDRFSGILPSQYTHRRSAVITDVRFVHEVSAIWKAGGKVYRIRRPGIDAAPHTHRSEEEQDQIPDDRLQGVIYNDGTLEDLKQKVRDFLG